MNTPTNVESSVHLPYIARCCVDNKDWVLLGFDKDVQDDGAVYLSFKVSNKKSEEDIYLTAKDVKGLRDTLTKFLKEIDIQ